METRPKNQNEQQKATKSIFHSHFHSFALDLWKVADIKSNENPGRATTGKEKQRKAAKSSEEEQQISELEKPNEAIKHQNEQQTANEQAL